MDYYAYIKEPEDYVTDERAELPEAELSVLTDLLEYCKSEQLAVVFTVSPYYVTKDDWALFNTIGDVIESYGYPYFNANAYYEEMGIDFSADFYNRSHVNYLGATKYTTYFADYLVTVSDLPDHREDAAYASWADGADTFLAWETERVRYVTNMENTAKDQYLAEQMRVTTNFSEWSSIAAAWRFTLLVSQNGTLTQPRKAADQSVLEIYGLYDSNMYGSIRVLEGNAVEQTNYLDGAESISGTIGVNEVSYTIENKDQNTSIVVDGVEYGNSEDDVVIVVVDNLLGEVVDTVNLKLSKKKIKLERLEETANE
jgi:hypothetical protein